MTFWEHQVVLYLPLLSLNMIIMMCSSYSYSQPDTHSPQRWHKRALPQSSFSCLQAYHTSGCTNNAPVCVIKCNGHHSNEVVPFCSRTFKPLPFFEPLMRIVIFLFIHRNAQSS